MLYLTIETLQLLLRSVIYIQHMVEPFTVHDALLFNSFDAFELRCQGSDHQSVGGPCPGNKSPRNYLQIVLSSVAYGCIKPSFQR